jgi:hypothetical protein
VVLDFFEELKAKVGNWQVSRSPLDCNIRCNDTHGRPRA